MENIVVTLIGSAITAIVTIVGILAANNAKDAAREAKEEMREQEHQEWRTRVESKLDEHNGYAKLFSEQSVVLARIDERLKALEGK